MDELRLEIYICTTVYILYIYTVYIFNNRLIGKREGQQQQQQKNKSRTCLFYDI